MLAAVSAFLGGTGGGPPASSASPSPNARKRAQPDDDQDAEGGAGESTGAAAAVASQRPRLMGGFLGDDSDDSDNDDAPGSQAGTAGLDKGKQPVRPAALAGTPPPAKKRMLAPPAQADAAMEVEDDEDEDEVAAAAAAFALPPTYRHPFAPADPSQRHDAPIPIVDDDNDRGHGHDDEQRRYDLLFGAARESMLLESETRPLRIQTCAGQSIPVRQRRTRAALPYEAMVAARSRTKEGRAARSFYGIDIHELVDGARKELAEQKAAQKQAAAEAEAAAEIAAKERAAAAAAAADRPIQDTQEGVAVGGGGSSSSSSKKKQQQTSGRPKKKRDRASMLWTEKYRARSFLDLVGDDLTNRLVLRWLKRWDPLVFPHATRAAPLRRRPGGGNDSSKTGTGGGNGADHDDGHGDKTHHKILILAGPPGLGKTTLAHVCARQAGYEVLEINASDERSRDVVNGRIRTSLGTESVKTVEHVTEKKSTAAAAAAAKTGSSSSSSLLLGGAAAQEAKPSSTAGKVARPVCVVVDEVDGVVGGSSSAGGEGGFVKALIDLVLLDQKNTGGGGQWQNTTTTTHRKKKGDDFRQMRPLILICNDVYHPALRPLRQSGLAEIVHVGKPSVEAVVARLKGIFEKEGIACEKEAARKLCEAAWGMTAGGSGSRPRRGGAAAESTADGDLRSVLVVGEWVARRLRATATAAPTPQLTRFWVDKHVLPDLAYGAPGGGGVGARGLGRGGTREIVMRVFQEGAGFPQTGGGGVGGGAYTASLVAAASATAATRTYRHEQPKQVQAMSFAEHHQRHALARLREMVETSGDVERIVTDVFATFPRRAFHDDAYLTKPDAAYEWLHFHDACAHRVFASQEWELAPYTSLPVLALHQLFGGRGAEEEIDDGTPSATAVDPDAAPAATAAAASAASPLAGPRADFAAREAEKQHLAALQALQARLPPSLLRAFRSPGDVAADLLPYVVRLVSPDVKPVLVNVASSGGDSKGGRPSGPTAVASVRRAGEKALVRRAAEVLAELGIRLRRGLLEEDGPSSSFPGRPQWVYRMDPDLDLLASFETARHLPLGGSSSTASAAASSQPTRYAVRQVLDQELRRTLAQRDNAARQARFQAGRPSGGETAADPAQQKRAATQQQLLQQQRLAAGADKENQPVDGIAGGKAPLQQQQPVGRRDFFGRLIAGDATPTAKTTTSKTGAAPATDVNGAEGIHVWVTYHEGLNNAVRKPISVEEFLRGL